MLQPNADALSISHRVLRILITLNWLFGAAVLGMLIWTFIAPEFVARALHVDGSPRALVGMRLIMVMGVAAAPVGNALLSRLLRIVETVRVGGSVRDRECFAFAGHRLGGIGVGGGSSRRRWNCEQRFDSDSPDPHG